MESRFNRSVLATLEHDMLERLKNGPVYVRAEAVVGVDKSVSVVHRLFEPDKNGEPVEVSTVFSRADTRISEPLSSLRANDGASFRDAKKRLPK